MGGPAVASKLRGQHVPVVRTAVVGIVGGLFFGYLWKKWHWGEQRKRKQFYEQEYPKMAEQGIAHRRALLANRPPVDEE